MNDFTASNGVGIRLTKTGDVDGDLDFKNGPNWLALCGGKVVRALREFFQAEADERLGRWRSEFHSDYFVIPSDQFRNGEAQGWVRIVHEPSYFIREAARSTPLRDVDFKWPDMDFGAVAAKFFDAHPEPKPWHDAQPGEVWALTWDGTEGVFLHAGGSWYGQGDMRVVLDHPIRDENVTAGRRVWPEVAP